MKKVNLFIVSLLVSLIAVSVSGVMNGVKAQTSEPSFPNCSTKTKGSGDWVTSGSGFHHIPGQEATIEGSDDVYYLEGDNFVQCLCGIDGNGVQTSWWNASQVDEEDISSYVSSGWYYEQGQSWNLINHPYLAKNTNYSCGTPTATPTPGPTSVPLEPEHPGMPGAPVCNDQAPESPVLLSVTRSGTDGVELIWTQPDANVEYYVLSYGLEPGKYIYGVSNTGKTTTFRVGSLDLSKKYYFTVRSQKGCAVSAASNELSYPRSVGGAGGLASTDSQMISYLLGVMVSGGVGTTAWSLWQMKRGMEVA